MSIQQLNFRNIQIALFIGLAAIFFSCTNENNVLNDDGKQGETEDLETDFKVFKAKQIFFALPSPIETAMILKKAGAQYNEDFLNKLDNVNKYTTSKQMALNLGVYSADLSYASLYDQNQTSIKYMAASKKLADKLGILSAIDQSIINRLENNVNNRDSIMDIISETFMNSNSYLKDNQRTQIAAIILAGGWIEGLYLSTQLVKTTKNNKDLITRIIDQKLSLTTLINMLENENKVPNEDITSILKDINEIKLIFDQVKVNSSNIEPVGSKDDKVTKLSVKTEMIYKKEDIDRLIVKVENFRTSVIK
ncbi:MAG: hypothetical protein HY958_09475 [Bacteroidia bacterium]|nr:hypothetical protein [Bacteroidia bacterium]